MKDPGSVSLQVCTFQRRSLGDGQSRFTLDRASQATKPNDLLTTGQTPSPTHFHGIFTTLSLPWDLRKDTTKKEK